MPGVVIPNDAAIDPPARHSGPGFRWWNRDQARAPMPWTGEPGAGFTTGHPWLLLPPDWRTRNVAAQRANPSSVLAFYWALLALRRASSPFIRVAWRVSRRPPPVSWPSGGGPSTTGRSWS